jgi:hypothetical protein
LYPEEETFKALVVVIHFAPKESVSTKLKDGVVPPVESFGTKYNKSK